MSGALGRGLGWVVARVLSGFGQLAAAVLKALGVL
jgi:hypothetical protein